MDQVGAVSDSPKKGKENNSTIKTPSLPHAHPTPPRKPPPPTAPPSLNDHPAPPPQYSLSLSDSDLPLRHRTNLRDKRGSYFSDLELVFGLDILDLMRNKAWAFIGDSLLENRTGSLLCLLSK
ncbi:hypothetical protein ACMD2_21164, partial [Ananas comosus]